MAQNITLLGANYPDVPAVQLPITGGGTATFSDTRSVTYNLSGGATASVTPSEAVTGQGFSVKLTAPTGYVLSGVTVTMGGTDITSQVFTPDEAGGGGGGSVVVTEEANATGITCVITTSSEPTPSETWETIWDTPITSYDDVATIPALTDYYYAANETYRVTLSGEEYRVDTYYYAAGSCYLIGNEGLLSDPSATGLPFLSYNVGWGALYVHIQNGGSGNTYPFKLEKLVTA